MKLELPETRVIDLHNISPADSMIVCLLLFTQLFLKFKRSESRSASRKRILSVYAYAYRHKLLILSGKTTLYKTYFQF